MYGLGGWAGWMDWVDGLGGLVIRGLVSSVDKDNRNPSNLTITKSAMTSSSTFNNATQNE